MPTETFFNLPKEKKDKIIIAAKKEFSRVAYTEASIKNITCMANIARGSFYQYFTSKEDLLYYILHENIRKVDIILKDAFEKTKGDIFQSFITLYDHSVDDIEKQKEDREFFEKILKNVKLNQEDFLFEREEECKKHNPEKEMRKYLRYINKDSLNVSSDDDLIIIFKLLGMITRKSIISIYSYKDKKEARQDYLKLLEYMKYGIIKKI